MLETYFIKLYVVSCVVYNKVNITKGVSEESKLIWAKRLDENNVNFKAS